ncbi:MAG: tetrahydromethanopterin S-methyltransferase subunit F [Methanothrix sp.]|nr:tetrahydromethanopterin S-methyltransferase subunit F [Methanothrix sp.]
MAEEKEVVYGQGYPTVVMTQEGYFDDIVEDIKYKGQLLARETKMSSGVLSTVSMGFFTGFIIALLMMIGPFFILQGGL